MNKEIVLVVVAILVFSASTFLINHYFLPAQLINIPQTYLFFTLASIITMLILVVVKRKNLDIVGVSFLLITTIKAGIAFWCGKNIIYASEKYKYTFEAWHLIKEEGILSLLVAVIGIISGVFPAISAYRTDISKTLTQS